jgi:hypothetical protein
VESLAFSSVIAFIDVVGILQLFHHFGPGRVSTLIASRCRSQATQFSTVWKNVRIKEKA